MANRTPVLFAQLTGIPKGKRKAVKLLEQDFPADVGVEGVRDAMSKAAASVNAKDLKIEISECTLETCSGVVMRFAEMGAKRHTVTL